MALVRYTEASPQGMVEFKDSLGTEMPYHYTINLAHVASMSRQSGFNHVQLLAGELFDLSDKDADALQQLVFGP